MQEVSRHAQTGLTRFVGTAPGKPLPRPSGVSSSSRPETVARRFLDQYARGFGIRDHGRELELMAVNRSSGDRSSVRFQQFRRDVPVLGGEVVLNLDRNGNLLSAGGEALPQEPVTTTAKVGRNVARRTARAAIAKSYGVRRADLFATAPELWIYDSRILGGPGLGRPTLVWLTEVRSRGIEPISELVLVDAELGSVALSFSQIHAAKDREVCDANNATAQLPCVSPVRTEGDPPHAVQDVNDAYDFAGDTYDFFVGLGRDSIDGAGMTITSTVRYCPSGGPCPYQNAFWDGQQMVYGSGFAAADDVVGHELAHGVTDFSSHLFYYYQSGAINESLSDVFGEFVDLTNSAGNDGPSVRWLLGEDIPGFGAIRDMEDPTAFGNPDRMTSPNYFTGQGDAGGVHSNSGVNNKAAFLITDGGTFNGETVTGLGITKASLIYYEVEVNHLTSASDYADLYDALQQACTNLVGTGGITAADCAEVTKAVDAVEMDVLPPGAPNPHAPVCPSGGTASNLFFDDLENPASGNWATQTATGLGTWYYPQNPNGILDATYATSGNTNFWGYNYFNTSDYRISMATEVSLPMGSSSYLHFAHAYGFEDDTGNAYDGGVLEYSTNGGSTWTDAGALTAVNGYNGTISNSFGNPLGGRSAFVRQSNGYIESRFDLSSLAGQNVRFRFRIGTDNTVDDYGWFIDDVRIYTCGSGGPNNPPAADAGGPYTITEGNPLSLNGSGSTDPDGNPLTYGWDLDGDLDYTDATGQSPVVSWAALSSLGLNDGPDSATVALRVTDSAAASDTDSVGLTLQNAAPTASISGPTAATTGASTTWTFSATDPSSADQAGSFTYGIDWDGNGTVDQTVIGDNSEPIAHTYPADATVTIRATATDKDGGTSSQTTRSVTVSAGGGGGEPDTTPPATTVVSGPSALTNDATPTFGFDSNEAGSTFECRVDADPFTSCTSPFTTDPLSDGAHIFEVRATDQAGNVDPGPASWSFEVDTVAPDATITKHPGNKTRNRRPKFKFSSGEDGVSFECRIDRKKWRPCSSPFRPGKKLNRGRHVFKIAAIDAAGNVNRPADKYKFKVIKTRRKK